MFLGGIAGLVNFGRMGSSSNPLKHAAIRDLCPKSRSLYPITRECWGIAGGEMGPSVRTGGYPAKNVVDLEFLRQILRSKTPLLAGAIDACFVLHEHDSI